MVSPPICTKYAFQDSLLFACHIIWIILDCAITYLQRSWIGALDPVPSQDESNDAYFFLKRSGWSLELVPLQIVWVTSVREQPAKKSAPSVSIHG